MKRSAPMKRTRLRSVSLKRRASRESWDAEYRKVDERAGLRCEVVLDGVRCPEHRRLDHHHLVKPRASNHDANLIVRICRAHHEMCDRPFSKGRLVPVPYGDGVFEFSLVYRTLGALSGVAFV